MSYYDDNIYYSPEKHGLKLIAEVDLSEPCYSFDKLAVWRDDEGFYLATDSGCSCPSPFENYAGKADITGPLSRADAIEESRSIYEQSSKDYFTGEPYEPEQFEAFIEKIKEA